MERPGFLKQIVKFLNHNKYPLLVLLLGAAFILWPSQKNEAPEPETAAAEPVALTAEEQMEDILSRMDGAGQVRVMLTKKTEDETVYQTDTVSRSNGEGNLDQEVQTVLASAAGGGEAPLIRQKIRGEYQGALIVCQGADSARVRLELVNAVADLTGLSTDRITVIKMKS